MVGKHFLYRRISQYRSEMGCRLRFMSSCSKQTIIPLFISFVVFLKMCKYSTQQEQVCYMYISTIFLFLHCSIHRTVTEQT